MAEMTFACLRHTAPRDQGGKWWDLRPESGRDRVTGSVGQNTGLGAETLE